jgi:Cu(I)/Ag(I) efflux system membrane fusion protein
MNNIVKPILGIALLAAVTATGYWFGTQRSGTEGSGTEAQSERKPLYYRNPMGLPDTSPVPKKDSMGMDYVPVYEGVAESGNQLSISIAKVQKLGVKSEAAALRKLKQTLHVTGRIEIDERRLHTIAPRFEGWVERLYVNTTGQAVGKGQPLFDVYSPELVSAQREHALAMQGLAALKDADDDAKQSMQQLAEASAARLKNWDMANVPADAGDSRPRVTFRSPANGIVLEKKAVQGMRFMPGEMLYQIADLSSVWVIAEVPEQDSSLIETGAAVQVAVDAWPERGFNGKVAFVYPTLNSATRTVPVRIEIANPKGLLKPGMFADAQIAAGKAKMVLAVPGSAVIDSGSSQTVLVRLAEGRFEPRRIKPGARSDDYVEVLEGIAAGEEVVTSANFLLDSESNLKAALAGMSDVADKPQAQHMSVGHQARGVLEAVNDDGTVSISHDPIPALKWPAMTMDFALANPSLAADIKPGSAVSFEIVERGAGEWVITRLQTLHQPGEH